MRIILHPFDQRFYGSDNFYPVFILVEIKYNYLSITGVQAPLKDGNARGSGGQINWEYEHRNKAQNAPCSFGNLIEVKDLRFSKGWTAEMWYTLLEYWEDWHLKNRESIPSSVLDWLLRLPETDRTPNWI